MKQPIRSAAFIVYRTQHNKVPKPKISNSEEESHNIIQRIAELYKSNLEKLKPTAARLGLKSLHGA